MKGVVGEREDRRSRSLEVTVEGKAVKKFWYDGMDTCDSQVGG